MFSSGPLQSSLQVNELKPRNHHGCPPRRISLPATRDRGVAAEPVGRRGGPLAGRGGVAAPARGHDQGDHQGDDDGERGGHDRNEPAAAAGRGDGQLVGGVAGRAGAVGAGAAGLGLSGPPTSDGRTAVDHGRTLPAGHLR